MNYRVAHIRFTTVSASLLVICTLCYGVVFGQVSPSLPDYCPSTSSSSNLEWISRVSLAGQTVNSGSSTYSDFTSETTKVLTQSVGYEIQVDVRTNGGTFTEYVRVWIDWNQNGIFDEPGELYDLGSQSVGSAPVTFSMSIVVPSDALVGYTGMRVSMRFSNPPSACGSIGDGEVEDYAIYVKPNPSCEGINLGQSALSLPSICPGGTSILSITGANIPSGHQIGVVVELFQAGAGQLVVFPGQGSGSNLNFSIDQTVYESLLDFGNPPITPGATIFVSSFIYVFDPLDAGNEIGITFPTITCSFSPVQQIAVLDLPTAPDQAVKIPNLSQVCIGTELTLESPAFGGNEGVSCDIQYRYRTSPQSAFLGSSTDIPVIETESIGVHIIQARRANCEGGCPLSAWQTLATWTVVAQPTSPNVASKSPNTDHACQGTTLTLTGPASGGSSGFECQIQYRYSSNDGGDWTTPSTTIPAVPATEAGPYLIQTRRANCAATCEETDWFTLAQWQIDMAPTAPSSISGNDQVCIGDTVTITALGGIDGSGAVFQWGTGSVIGQNLLPGSILDNIEIAPEVDTTYWVRRIGTTACVAPTEGVLLHVTAIPPDLCCFAPNLVQLSPEGSDYFVRLCGPESVSIGLEGDQEPIFLDSNGGYGIFFNPFGDGPELTTYTGSFPMEIDRTLGGTLSEDLSGLYMLTGFIYLDFEDITGSPPCAVAEASLLIDFAESDQFECVLSTDVNTGHNQLNIFPNPTTGAVTIDLFGPRLGRATIEITDAAGKLIRTENTSFENGGDTHQLSLEGLHSGFYIVRIAMEHSQYTKRILKL